MDIFPIFRASAQAYKLCNKEAAIKPMLPDSRLRNAHKFNQQAKQINFLSCWLGGASLMTDYERDRIDCQSQALIKTCQHVISNLKKISESERVPSQVRHHQQAVIEIVTEFLKAVTKIYSEQRAIRVQRSVESRKIFRLENLVAYTSHMDGPLQHSQMDENIHNEKSIKPSTYLVENFDSVNSFSVRRRKKLDSAEHSLIARSDSTSRKVEQETQKSLKIIQKSMHQKVDKAKLAALHADVELSKEEWTKVRAELRPEEKVQLEMEGKSLREEFTAKVDEIKKLEGKVVEIARLQDIFTEKVLLQEQDIYRINDVAIHTTENLKMANESIREAMKRKANMRIYIIFVLIVLSFTLLFLDWYNP